MPPRSSAKYLLSGLLALTVISIDAYFGLTEKHPHAPATSRQPAATAPRKTVALASPSSAPLSHAPVAPTAPVVSPQPPAQAPLVEQLKAIDADYKELAQPILDRSDAVIAPDDRAKLAFLDQEKLADLGKVLTTEELDVYQNQADPSSAPQRR